MTFDFAGFGESHGEPRRAAAGGDPRAKIRDIHGAAEFLRSMAFIDADRIGCVADGVLA